VVPPHAAVLAREPVRAALSEEDVARHHVFAVALFGAQALSGAGCGLVGAPLGGVRGWAGLGECGWCVGGDGEAAEGKVDGGGGV
jgi:hypothetical protein